MINLVLIEDQEEIRKGLTFLINSSDGLVCKSFGSAEDALIVIESETPDVVLMDINLPGMSGIECTKIIKGKYPSIEVMMVTVYDDDEKIFNALKAGASGYILKKLPPAQLIESVKELINGGAPMSSQIARKVVDTFHPLKRAGNDYDVLSDREKEVLNLLAEGYRNKEIASKLFLSNHTIRAHIYTIYQKLHVRTRVEAINKISNR